MITGFVPSYVLDSGIGKKIAKLKGMKRGWHYPTFLLYYIRNPGPLLLFDEIIVDKEAARKAIDYVSGNAIERRPKDYEGRVTIEMKPTKSEVEIFHELLESRLFRKVNVEKMITDTDFEQIEQGYRRDVGISEPSTGEFRKAVSIMENRYGPNYALPDPERFEAMNINVTWVLLAKLSAIPLDDVLRSPLYEYKMISPADVPQTKSSGGKTMESIAGLLQGKTAYDMINQARQVLFLPTEPLHDIDSFVAIHKAPQVRSFRNKVYELSRRKATPREISREISEANRELQELEMDSWNVVIGLIGIVGTLTSMLQGNFVTGLFGTTTALISLGKEIRKAMLTERYGWLEMVKGLCEIGMPDNA